MGGKKPYKKAQNGCISLKGNQDGHTADQNDELAAVAAHIYKKYCNV